MEIKWRLVNWKRTDNEDALLYLISFEGNKVEIMTPLREMNLFLYNMNYLCL